LNQDPLTKMNYRRALFEFGEIIFEQSLRYKHSYAFIMLDVDHFKKINDTYGYPVGDQALIAIKESIAQVTCSSDISARIGGEEFAIMLPETSINDSDTTLNVYAKPFLKLLFS